MFTCRRKEPPPQLTRSTGCGTSPPGAFPKRLRYGQVDGVDNTVDKGYAIDIRSNDCRKVGSPWALYSAAFLVKEIGESAPPVKRTLQGQFHTAQFAIRVVDLMQTAYGGLPGLLDRFRDNGFDDAVRSWVSVGSNFILTPQDIERVLGPAGIEALAREANLGVRETATEVAVLLPQLVDKLTPQGHVPDEQTLAGYFDQLKSKIGML